MAITTQAPPARVTRPPVDDAITLSGVSRSYRTRNGVVEALADVCLRVAPDERVALVGPSGCGKSTLLELVCGLGRPDAGMVRAQSAVLMPQRDLLLPWLNALDNAALPLRVRGVGRHAARGRARALLAELGLDGFQRARPDELSGGMRQRVAFARTLLADKALLCLDEPFASLDAITRPELHAFVDDALSRAPRTVLLVTHDVEEAVVLADRVAVMSSRPGRIVGEVDLTASRPRAVSAPEVVEARARVLALLRGGAV